MIIEGYGVESEERVYLAGLGVGLSMRKLPQTFGLGEKNIKKSHPKSNMNIFMVINEYHSFYLHSLSQLNAHCSSTYLLTHEAVSPLQRPFAEVDGLPEGN